MRFLQLSLDIIPATPFWTFQFPQQAIDQEVGRDMIAAGHEFYVRLKIPGQNLSDLYLVLLWPGFHARRDDNPGVLFHTYISL